MSLHFAPNTNFNSSRSKSKKTPTKSSQSFSNQSLMSISELGEKHISQGQEENYEFLQQIKETKADLLVLMGKTKSYSKNTGVSYKDTITPRSQKKAYQKSPFGESLHITDYSYFCTPISKSNK
ncbi:hypothetical protein M9Y10_022443 [Tritrichomonas musculus]|uniref:Uncharacterized protein n=1 Tax=Tritrichomonas musculus TaxID=1915356 RepID=A0ABR2KSM3_9EUKA